MGKGVYPLDKTTHVGRMAYLNTCPGGRGAPGSAAVLLGGI